MDTIETFGGVKEIKYRTKDEALKILKNRWGENAYLLDSLGDNPLPNSILITVDSLDSANNVYAQGNIWSVAVQDSVSIESVIFHKNDLSTLGEVIFMPAGETNSISMPSTSTIKSQDIIYDMHGIRHEPASTLPKGIYIINGKKTIIK